jgi:hypothetical protein
MNSGSRGLFDSTPVLDRLKAGAAADGGLRRCAPSLREP